MMSWFEDLTGGTENSPDSVRQQLFLDGPRLRSHRNGQSWLYGELERPTLAQLRERVQHAPLDRRPNKVCEVVANVQHLHRDEENRNALFQVASQFNLLEMSSPGITPDAGIGIYEHDYTQGPACAIAAGAGTIFRNYFVDVDGQIGQTADRQLNCLAGVGDLLGNSQDRLWQMVNGYALPSEAGLTEIHRLLSDLDAPGRDQLRQALQIGVQWETQVTLDRASHTVSQAYCSAFPIAYTPHEPTLWAPFAQLILEAAYEATLCTAILNRVRTGGHRLFLTLLGGGAFGNRPDWIINALRRALEEYADFGLTISIVSYGASKRDVRQLVGEFT